MSNESVRVISMDVEGQPTMHTIWNDADREHAGTALVTHNGNGHAILWIISVAERFRKKGYASALLAQMQQVYEVIETSWISEAGKALCFKCGFKFMDGKPNSKHLVWTKEKNEDASKNDEDGERQVPGIDSKHGPCERDDEGECGGTKETA